MHIKLYIYIYIIWSIHIFARLKYSLRVEQKLVFGIHRWNGYKICRLVRRKSCEKANFVKAKFGQCIFALAKIASAKFCQCKIWPVHLAL